MKYHSLSACGAIADLDKHIWQVLGHYKYFYMQLILIFAVIWIKQKLQLQTFVNMGLSQPLF